MKKILIPMVLSLAFLSSFSEAAERAFRVNAASMVGRYAIAWGVEGASTDFEAIEAKGSDAVDAFLNSGAPFRNYLIDVVTNSIVKEFSGTEDVVVGSLGGLHLGSKFGLNLVEGQSAVFNDADADIIFQVSSSRWDSEIGAIFAIQSGDGDGKTPKIVVENDKAQAQINEQIVAHLSKTQKDFWEKTAHNVTLKKDENTGKMHFQIEAYIPKGSGPTMLVSGILVVGTPAAGLPVNLSSFHVTKK